jgi:archaellum biogenesis ATPase FlaH
MDYSINTQQLLLSFMIADPEAFTISQGIVKTKYFDDRLRPVMQLIQEHADKYKTLPTHDIIKAQTTVEIGPFVDASKNRAWFLDTIEGFCRYRALEDAILTGADLLMTGKGGDVERLVKEAMTIKLISELGSDFKADPAELLARLSDKRNYVSTGWSELDDKLYGGFTKASLNIFAGTSGSGKSLFLQNLALNWVNAGLNVAYVTLELSEDLVNLRLYSMVTGLGTRGVMRDQDAATITLRKMFAKITGSLMVKKYPEAGTATNDLKAYLKEYEIQQGHKPDILIVDYLDLMYPNNNRVDVSNLFAKDKNVAEEMRALATEWNIPVVTASQLNRSAQSADEHDHSHIAGGISKINTADNVISILTTHKVRESGVQHIQFLKTRNSNAVGSKIKFDYDVESMRITDFTGDHGLQTPAPEVVKSTARPTSDILNSIAERAARGKQPDFANIGGDVF